MRRLLEGVRVGLASSPTGAHEVICALGTPDVLVLEDRAWPVAEERALAALRLLVADGAHGSRPARAAGEAKGIATRRMALILSRQRGNEGAHSLLPPPVPVVERPYRLDELSEALRIALHRARA